MITSFAELMNATAVRTQSARVAEHVRDGGGMFAIDSQRLAPCAEFVVDVTRRQYPDLEIPYHSRWRHFSAPGVSLDERLAAVMSAHGQLDAARAGFDLVIPSVLLDAGAGAEWAFLPAGGAEPIGRSEGLGLASLAMFLDGAFSTDGRPRTDAAALAALSAESLESGFQVSETNPLVGVEGRLEVLRRLGAAMSNRPDLFPSGRPGDLVDHVVDASTNTAAAPAILELLLEALAPIWPQRLVGDGIALGDAWIYEPFGSGPDAIVPFHKLSQWMTYSLVETLERSGVDVTDLDQLTGLPEYRNGGLLLETGVVALRDAALAHHVHDPASQLIVEWRALTIVLLDEVAAHVRDLLDRPSMPLAEILEGGTWAAGRALAFERTPTGTPPLQLDSDGTVF